ncbi:MAG: hypothetical protein ACO2PN_11295 [Pyrobaculum sp.]|jgi:hypothetical protein
MTDRNQGPEILEQNDYMVLYRDVLNDGVVLKHCLPCECDTIYLSGDRLRIYHEREPSKEAMVPESLASLLPPASFVKEIMHVILDSETAEQIRKEMINVRTFIDFCDLVDRLLRRFTKA